MNKYNFNNDSLFFKDVLTPADGYEVVFAVGTTYSINMSTFLTVPIMLGAIGDVELADTNTDASAMAIIHAILQMKEKFCVFVNAGGIHVDKHCNDMGKKLFALMDSTVNEINLNSSPDTVYNFHPKVWFVRERNAEGNERVKVVTLSKNLSADPNLDIVCELSGNVLSPEETISAEQSLKHQPLIDFLEYLLAQSKKVKPACRKQIRELEACIRRVAAFNISDFEGFDDYAFMPILPDKKSPHFGTKCLARLAGKGVSCFVVSPFLGETIVGKFVSSNDKSANRILVTRRESLANITQQQFERFNEVYVVKESATDEGNEVNVSMDIHAKLYLTMHNGGRSWLFLGSANATNNAFANNVEFLVGFRIKPHAKEYDQFVKTFLEMNSRGVLASTSLFESIAIHPSKEDFETFPDDSGNFKLREALQALKNAVAKVSKNEDGSYDIAVHSAIVCESAVAIYPLMAPEQKCRLERDMLFTGMTIDSVSAFFVLEATNDNLDVNGKEAFVSTIVKLHIEGLPEQAREDNVFKQFIDTSDKIYNYLTFVVADDKQEVIDAMSRQVNDRSKTLSSQLLAIGGLFEKLMRSSLTMPMSIVNEMSKVLANLDESNGLRQMIERYESVLKKIKKIRIDA